MTSLIYISRAVLDYPDAVRQFEDIRLASLVRNSQLDVTGLLVATPVYFAQLLEGDDRALDGLMASICRDPRHRDVVVLDRNDEEERVFSRWSMACFGPSSFVSRTIHPVLDPLHGLDGSRPIGSLRDLMRRLVPRDGTVAPRLVRHEPPVPR